MEFEVSEEEFQELGRPTFGDKMEVEMLNPSFKHGYVGPVTEQRMKVKPVKATEWLARHLPAGRNETLRALVVILKSYGWNEDEATVIIENAVREGLIFETKPGLYRRLKA
jgi:hypothetical protein